MPPYDNTLEQDEYRLVLLRAGSHAIWARRDNRALHLPSVAIPRWTRPAEQLQQAVEGGWHVRAIVLDFLRSESGSNTCVVVEILSPEPPGGLAASSIDDVLEEEMTRGEREVVKAILAGTTSSGPFSRLGWIGDAFEWMQKFLGNSIKFTGDVLQYNATGNFALARFATETGPAYWLKATGELHVHEFQITKMLAERCPEYLPRRIAERKDWNAWLMEDAGYPLNSWTLPALERAVSSMAMLQQETIGQTNPFLTAGAFDQRLCVLRAHLAELVEYLNEAMANQVSARVPRIEKGRLWQMAGILEDACWRMEALEIPDTLIHSDVNSGNILFQGANCVFTDWCETGIGNPFFTLQYLCLLQPPGEEHWAPRLKEVYKQCWLDRLSTSQTDRAFALMPLLLRAA